MYKNSKEYKNKIEQSIKIDSEYKQTFGSFDIETENIRDDPKRINFIFKNMLANPSYVNRGGTYDTLICILDYMFEHTSVELNDNAVWCSGTYTKWKTPWDFSILYDKKNDWSIKYDNLSYWGDGLYGYACIPTHWIPNVIQKMKENPKILTKSASVIVLEKELNMTAKLHHIFGCWYLRPNDKDCLVNGMFNNPFNIPPFKNTISEWTFDICYKDGIIDGQTISDIFKHIM